MKKYDMTIEFNGEYGQYFVDSVPDETGQWVPASVAQALYDALNRASLYLDTSCEYNEVIMDILADSAAAISLADGESE